MEGLLVYGRWCPLENTGSTAYGLEPGPDSVFVFCVCVFLTFVTGTTTATESAYVLKRLFTKNCQ